MSLQVKTVTAELTTNHSKPVAAKLGEDATVFSRFSVDVKGKRIDLKLREFRAKYKARI